MPDISRRRALSVIGAGGLFVTAGSVPAAAGGRGELPNDNVSRTRVGPFDCDKTGFCDTQPQEVPAGDWIVHDWGWHPTPRDGDGGLCADESEQRDVLNGILENTEWRVWIGGEEIEDPKQYWDIVKYEPDVWILRWRYVTPPKQPGQTYEFRYEKTVEERHQVGWQPDSCEPRYIESGELNVPPGGAYRVTKQPNRDGTSNNGHSESGR